MAKSMTRQSSDARDAALQAMPRTLRVKVEKLEGMLLDQVESTIRFYYALGQELAEIEENPDNKYGENPTELVAVALSKSITTVRNACHFYKCYNESELNALIKRRPKPDTGFRLKWAHVSILCRIVNKNERKKMESFTVENELSAAELQQHVKKYFGGPRSRGGRPVKRPASLTGALSQFQSVTGKWVKLHNEVWRAADHDIFAAVRDMPPEKVTPELKASVAEIVALSEQLQEAAAGMAQEGSSTLQQVEQILSQADDEEETEEETAEPRSSDKRQQDRTRSAASKAAQQARTGVK